MTEFELSCMAERQEKTEKSMKLLETKQKTFPFKMNHLCASGPAMSIESSGMMDVHLFVICYIAW